MLFFIILLIMLIISIYFLFNFLNNKNDYFEIIFNESNNINYYVITLNSKERNENIKLSEKKYNINIQIIEGVNWINVNQNELLNKNVISSDFKNNLDKRSKEIACYLSHFKIYNLIKDSNKKDGYSVIFEDDFNILENNLINNNFNEEIESVINIMKEDFDIIFLGNTFDNSKDRYKRNIFNIDKNKETIGCYGYLINNSSINKILNQVNYIDEPIDSKLSSLIKTDNLRCFVLKPNIVNYKVEFTSQINK